MLTILAVITIAFWDDLWKKLLYNLPHCLKSVAMLSC